MNRIVTGYYLITLGIISAISAYAFTTVDLTAIEEYEMMFKIEMIGMAVGAFLLIWCGIRWAGDGRSPSFFLSTLILYSSSTFLGINGFFAFLIARQNFLDVIWDMEDSFIVWSFFIVAILGLITIVVMRLSMRDPDNLYDFGWNPYEAEKATGLLRILIALFLPALVFLAIMLIFLNAGASAAMDTWTCPSCGARLSGGNTCPKCGARR